MPRRPDSAGPMRCIQGGSVLGPRTGIEHVAVYGEVYPADQRIVHLAGHLFCELGREDHAPEPVGERLAGDPIGTNDIDMNPRLIRPNAAGIQWRR